MVSRPHLYARTPPIQNLDETEVAWEKNVFFLFFWGTFFHKKARARVHVHVGHVECRVDTHGAMTKIWPDSVVGTQRNSTVKTWSFIENKFYSQTDKLNHSLTLTPPIEATDEGVA